MLSITKILIFLEFDFNFFSQTAFRNDNWTLFLQKIILGENFKKCQIETKWFQQRLSASVSKLYIIWYNLYALG